MSWTAGLMEDNTAKREKKEAEESEDSRHDEKKNVFVVPRACTQHVKYVEHNPPTSIR